MTLTALIAEDEPMLAANLQAELSMLWPALQMAANVRTGQAALAQALALQPDVLFLDIRMPGMSGLEVAQALAEDWPARAKPFPLLVFVTAYDQYAVQAFERAAIDYVLKPVLPVRLAQTCVRLQAALALRASSAAPALEAVVGQLRALLGAQAGTPMPATPLRVLQVSSGNAITMVPVEQVLYFEVADKYIRVLTASQEHLLRMPLRELLAQLDPDRFWQIHRGTVVRCDASASAVRDEAGKLTVRLCDRPEKLGVSRLYAHLFKGM
jgi:DNA-binding LytR/AlgR family response regulator